MLTVTADSSAPTSPTARADHYRRHLVDAHRVIGALQVRTAELEKERDEVKRNAAYELSLVVTRSEAERARLAAFRLAIGKAVALIEGPDRQPNMLSDAISKIPEPSLKWRN